MKRVEEFLHDEHLDSLAIDWDRTQLSRARTATYVVHQDVAYTYERPVRDLHQRLVVMPRRSHGDQQRIAQRFEVRSNDSSVFRTRSDRFGNSVVHVDAPTVDSSIVFSARSVITRDTSGSSEPAWSAAGPVITELTTTDVEITQAAADLRRTSGAIETAEQVCDLVHRSFRYQHDVTTVRTTASQAWQLRRGVCQDMAHVAIAMCTTLGIATRYVSGHLVGDGASHAWIEVYDRQRHRIVAIDPTHDRRVDLRYVTTATGRDYRDVAPTTGTYTSTGGFGTDPRGVAHGRLTVRKKIRLAAVE